MKQMSSLWRNWWTLAGAGLAVLSGLFILSFLFFEMLSPTGNPYTGLWTFLVFPLFLVAGLLLIPLGWLLERRKRGKGAPETKSPQPLLHLDLSNPDHRRGLWIFGLGTLVVMPLIGFSSYQGYHYTDSTQFCGQVCHSVMHPEYTAYRGSPHARVSCAECHIGSGADWYVKSKLSGVRQVFAVIFNTYSKPIPTPVHNLRPARETCEQCHWPAKFFGSQLMTRAHFSSDEKNTRSELRILVKTGGGDSSLGPASGIHWHMALKNVIEYIATDTARQVIPWVRATEPSGKVTVYRSDGKSSQDPPPQGELRRIDCVDCHNRPTHITYPPDRAVNVSLETGRMDRTLPYIKKVAVEALTEPYSTEEEAEQKIEAWIQGFYQKAGGQTAELRKGSIRQAVEETRAIYRRNFFPRMRVNWRSYPDNIGHMFFEGCFRCHDDRHVSDDRRSIRKDCTVCHEFQKPVTVAGVSGAFQLGPHDHPVKLEGKHAGLNCSSCHTGGRAPEQTCAGCHTREKSFALGQSPVLPGLKGTPSSMADVDCDSCHDLSKALTQANIAPRCETCHDKGYGDMIQLWKDEAATERAKASAALAELMKKLQGMDARSAETSRLRALQTQMDAALRDVDRAGPLHNPEFATAIYQHVVKATTATPAPPVTQ
jgi:hypothetical protein